MTGLIFLSIAVDLLFRSWLLFGRWGRSVRPAPSFSWPRTHATTKRPYPTGDDSLRVFASDEVSPRPGSHLDPAAVASDRIVKMNPPKSEQTDRTGATANRLALPSIVRNLGVLLEQGAKFSTIYADPPWPYSNRASRGAAENHYRTMPVEAICDEPVEQLAADNAHLHLWTTNGFLREAFDVIEAWGFQYKSCLIWTKPQLGMGNYWRVSHEYVLLGVRGRLPFRDHSCQSWLSAPRTIHSRKPSAVRALVERVSPGPYLELYGREHRLGSGWTVYGDQVERRLF